MAEKWKFWLLSATLVSGSGLALSVSSADATAFTLARRTDAQTAVPPVPPRAPTPHPSCVNAFCGKSCGPCAEEGENCPLSSIVRRQCDREGRCVPAPAECAVEEPTQSH